LESNVNLQDIFSIGDLITFTGLTNLPHLNGIPFTIVTGSITQPNTAAFGVGGFTLNVNDSGPSIPYGSETGFIMTYVPPPRVEGAVAATLTLINN